MARRFAKVSEEEIKTAFFNPSDQGRGRAVDIYLDASRLGIYPPLFTSPSGDSFILSRGVITTKCMIHDKHKFLEDDLSRDTAKSKRTE